MKLYLKIINMNMKAKPYRTKHVTHNQRREAKNVFLLYLNKYVKYRMVIRQAVAPATWETNVILSFIYQMIMGANK